MITLRLDPAVNLNIQLRVERDGVGQIEFYDNAGDPVDITGTEWTLFFRENENSEDTVLELTIGDGLEITGDDNEILEITVTDAVTILPAKVYFFELYRSDLKQTWFTGDAHVIKGKWVQ